MNIRTLLVISFFTIGLLGIANQAHAQDEGAMLPDINPQDIEIRGEFKARFYGLSRQPILGFDPKLQVHQIDPDRMPFMETNEQRVANLPVSSLTRPAPPSFTGLRNAEEINVFTRAGIGSYTSPEAKFWGVTSLGNGGYIGGDLDLSSSAGHLEESSSFRFLNANAEYGTPIGEKTELRVYAGVQNDFNYAADFDETRSGIIPRFTYDGYHGGVELERRNNDIAGWKLKGNIRSFNTSIENADFAGEMDEIVYQGSFENRWALGNPNETIALKAMGRGGSYELQGQDTKQWSTLQGGGAYERLFNYRTNVHIEANAYYVKDVTEEQFYLGGLVKIDHWFGDRLKVTGKAQGRPQLSTVEELHERNRFLGLNSPLNHSYQFDITGKASIKYYRGSKLHGGIRYSNTQDYLYFEPDPASGDSFDNYNVLYQNATNFKLFAGITHQLLPERFWLSGQIYIQNPELSNGEKIPFQESWGINASVSFKPIDRITVKGWANYVGERETGLNNNTLVDFLLIGSQLDVEITDNVGGYLKLVNITDQRYKVWQGYIERPFQIYGGLTLKF